MCCPIGYFNGCIGLPVTSPFYRIIHALSLLLCLLGIDAFDLLPRAPIPPLPPVGEYANMHLPGDFPVDSLKRRLFEDDLVESGFRAQHLGRLWLAEVVHRG